MKTTGTATILLDAMVIWCEEKSIYMLNIYSGFLGLWYIQCSS